MELLNTVAGQSAAGWQCSDATLHDAKAAIELKDATGIFTCLGLSEHVPRHMVIAALEMLNGNDTMSAARRRQLLSHSLLFQRLDEPKRARCATILIAMQDRSYLQRLIDLLDE